MPALTSLLQSFLTGISQYEKDPDMTNFPWLSILNTFIGFMESNYKCLLSKLFPRKRKSPKSSHTPTVNGEESDSDSSSNSSDSEADSLSSESGASPAEEGTSGHKKKKHKKTKRSKKSSKHKKKSKKREKKRNQKSVQSQQTSIKVGWMPNYYYYYYLDWKTLFE